VKNSRSEIQGKKFMKRKEEGRQRWKKGNEKKNYTRMNKNKRKIEREMNIQERNAKRSQIQVQN